MAAKISFAMAYNPGANTSFITVDAGGSSFKSIINKNMQAVATVPFEKGHIDIDTAADLLNLIQEK